MVHQEIHRRKNMVEMQELQGLIGKPYTPETARLMRYGGTVNSKGIIVEVETKEVAERKIHRCKNRIKSAKRPTLKNRLKSLLK